MRLIGHLNSEVRAHTLSDYLYVQGIKNQIEREKDDFWAVWVHDEDEVPKAKQLLTDYQNDPAGVKYKEASRTAVELRDQEQEEEVAYRKKIIDGRQLIQRGLIFGVGPVTVVLIIASIAVFFMSKFGDDREAIRGLLISEHFASGRFLDRLIGLPELRKGEIWRLFTPALIHFGILHIVFNMMALRDLGSMIEGYLSSGYLIALVVVIAILSNVAQYVVTGSPLFGGMSGVVYGLLGYVWLRGKFDPASGFYLHPTTVTIMLVWYFLCLFNIIQPVANVVHTVGLGIGMLWGYLASLARR